MEGSEWFSVGALLPRLMPHVERSGAVSWGGEQHGHMTRVCVSPVRTRADERERERGKIDVAF